MLKLLDSITNGTRTDINETGTSLYFMPGMLTGGKCEFDCQLARSMGYYLQVLMCLAPFFKQPLEITLNGVTNDPIDASVSIVLLCFLLLLGFARRMASPGNRL